MIRTKCAKRKRIWQIDCNALDFVIAASFEWREIINLMQGFNHYFDPNEIERALELQAQVCLHQHCHTDNEVSRTVESLLNLWHAEMMNVVGNWSVKEIHDYIMHIDFKESHEYVKGLIWALSTDSRGAVIYLRKRLMVRFQLAACRGKT